jgi:phage tail-like protein
MIALPAKRNGHAELLSPAPLIQGLPALYREPDPGIGERDETFVLRFTGALDAVLAPVFSTLDNLPAYFDPRTTPEHFLDWLAGWVALELYEKWSPELRRKLVADAIRLHRDRGTKLGFARVVKIFTDATWVAIQESGGVWGDATTVLDDGRFPEFPAEAASGSWMTVKVAIGEERYARDGEVESVTGLVHRVADRVKPAHVVLREVVVSA